MTPEEDAADVEIGATVSIEFNQDVTETDLNDITIEDSGTNPVTGVTASLSGKILTIDHNDFDYSETYTVTVPAGAVANTNGVENNEISWSFTTADAYKFVKSWDSNGSGDGEFNHPVEITADNFDNMYIADYYNHRVQKFEPAE